MKTYDNCHSILHGIIYSLLIVMLLMCGVFFWGAFNNHRITLHNIQEECHSILNIATGKDRTLVEKRIKSLEGVQKDLFETNTISFFFHIFSFAIVVVGGYILSSTLRNLREAESAVNNIRRSFGGFVGSQRFQLQLQFSLWELHVLCLSMTKDSSCGEIADTLSSINADCLRMPVTEIAMSDKVCNGNRGMVDDVKTMLEKSGMLIDPTRVRLVKLEEFLSKNQGRFARRWEKYCNDLEIESIDMS